MRADPAAVVSPQVGGGLVNRAFNTLLYYRNLNRNYQRKTDVRDVRLYNTVLSGLARKVSTPTRLRRLAPLTGGP